MPEDSTPLAQFIWTVLAALAGALTALSYRPFRGMSTIDVFLALFVGASFAIFAGPWFVKMIFGEGEHDARMIGALYYGLASGSNVIIPSFVRWLRAKAGNGDIA